MNKCTGYWLDNFVRTTATCKTILPKFISMENNLTATIIIYYIWMDLVNGTQYMYKTKLVIPSTQTDILPQHKLFLGGYAVLNRTVWYIQPRPRPLLGWLWQVSLAGLVNFRLAFGNYRNGHSSSAPPPNHLVPVFSCEKALNIKKIIKIEGLGLGCGISLTYSCPSKPSILFSGLRYMIDSLLQQCMHVPRTVCVYVTQ